MPARIGSRSTFRREAWGPYAVVIVLGLAAMAGLLAGRYDSTDTVLRDWPYFIGAFALALVFAFFIEGVRDLRTGARLRHVGSLRPDATVYPVQSFHSMLLTARRLKVSGDGVRYSEWSCQVVAVLPDRVEYWATNGVEPRWSVPRAHMAVSLKPVEVGMRRIDMLRIADTASPAVIEVRPVGRPIWTSYQAKYRQEAMELLILELDHDPTDVLVEK